MTTFKKTARFLGLAVAVLGLSGCLSGRSIIKVEDHPAQQVTMMQTMDVYTYIPFLLFVPKHQFWECTQASGALSCTRTCGEGTQFACPMGFAGIAGGSSNVR